MLIGTASIGALAACSTDRIAAPVAVERSNGLVGDALKGVTDGLKNVKGLKRDKRVDAPITRSATFTKAGGALSIPELGFTLTVPAGAIPGQSLRISVTALPGKMVAYDFEPHGTTFLQPLTFSQELRGTDALLGLLTGPDFGGGYFKSQTQLNHASGTAVIDESFGVRLNRGTAAFDISHFSGYMVSTGRSAPSDESSLDGSF